jgi:transcriptional regulator with XRE-family HTH domain
VSNHRLPHYLRLHRKRAGLSQDEVAWLLGAKSGTKVSRYERFGRQPTLATAFAYEVLFDVPASEIFAGVFEQAKEATLARADAFLAALRKREVGPSVHRGRTAFMERLAASTPGATKS